MCILWVWRQLEISGWKLQVEVDYHIQSAHISEIKIELLLLSFEGGGNSPNNDMSVDT
jgi:hypothetical protein